MNFEFKRWGMFLLLVLYCGSVCSQGNPAPDESEQHSSETKKSDHEHSQAQALGAASENANSAQTSAKELASQAAQRAKKRTRELAQNHITAPLRYVSTDIGVKDFFYRNRMVNRDYGQPRKDCLYSLSGVVLLQKTPDGYLTRVNPDDVRGAMENGYTFPSENAFFLYADKSFPRGGVFAGDWYAYYVGKYSYQAVDGFEQHVRAFKLYPVGTANFEDLQRNGLNQEEWCKLNHWDAHGGGDHDCLGD